MNSLNSVLLEGNLTHDPVSRPLPNGGIVCDFGIATNRDYTKNHETHEEVSFFTVECWGSTADKIMREVKKGSRVSCFGRLRQDRWTDKDGNNQSKVKIIAEHIEIKPR
jgi:single-strand DNA-binding protein